jgi:tetratricopeptide (TPR) repeat protein
MTSSPVHRWILAPQRRARLGRVAGLSLPPALLPAVDAHRRLRGPYTAAGTIARGLAATAIDQFPELVDAHQIELLTVAPELRTMVPATRETLTSLAVPDERTRFYSRLRTGYLSHGLTEFVRDYVLLSGGKQRSLVVDNLDAADYTDQELVSILLRRIDPALVMLVVGTSATMDDQPLGIALTSYAQRQNIDAVTVQPSTRSAREHCVEYVESDCTSDEPELIDAYAGLADQERRLLHDDRADRLTALGEFSLTLGAIPFHREHGTRPADRGAQALRAALDYCINMGFYHATIDFGQRGREVIDWREQVAEYWLFTTKMTTSLAALERPEEAEKLYDEARALSTSPNIHQQAAYATAMLYTRHFTEERRDHHRALGLINQAIAFATTITDARDRSFHTVFNENGRALIENHLGRPQEALRLVTEGIERLNRELGPGEHGLHRSVLVHNRSRILLGLGRLPEALADLTAVIEADPNYPDYYFDRAAVLRRLDRDDEALADYDTAIRLSPPFPEVYYNRADLRLARGDVDEALADFSYVLELNPQYLDAWINRAGLLAGLGRAQEARADVEAGLALAPNNGYLLCLLGNLELGEGRLEPARAAFEAVIVHVPDLPEAWASRATFAFEAGNLADAVADLNRAIELDPTAEYFFNRGIVHEALEHWSQAEADFSRVIDLKADETDAWQHLEVCRQHLNDAGRTSM